MFRQPASPSGSPESDLLQAFRRVRFSDWLPPDRIFPQGADKNCATLAAIRRIRATLPESHPVTADKLFYLV